MGACQQPSQMLIVRSFRRAARAATGRRERWATAGWRLRWVTAGARRRRDLST